MKRILSIDDEPAILDCLARALESQGYEFRMASDSQQGLELFQRERFDLALLDIRMPGKNGFEIYEEMRAIRPVPVIFVTGYPDSFDARSLQLVRLWQEEFADGTTDILYKPFALETLFEKVEALIGEASEPLSPPPS